MQQQLINYISVELINEELDEELDIHDDLLGGGIIDSLGMMKLIGFIESEFKIQVPPEDLIIENFMTIMHITDYLKTKVIPSA
ncbi:hypothetical protein GTQ40_07440 [Flavobacteriaceae bacterium R38]|nr:hypothetical protein [Flavobacteriaceae bacterium R38]